MDHQSIEDQHVVQRYLLGKLPEEDRQRFEEHFLDCPHCLDRLEEAEALHRGLEAVEAEELGRSPVAAKPQLRPLPWALAAAGLLLALGAAFFAYQVAVLQETLDRIDLATGPPVVPPSPTSETGRGSEALAKGAASPELERLEAELARERAARSRAEERLGIALSPPGGTLLAFLSPVRSDSPGAPEAVRIRPPVQPARVVFFLEIGDQGYETYRAVLRDEEGGEALWRSAPAALPSEGELVVSLLSSQLPGGRSYLVVEGLSAGSLAHEVARFELDAGAGEAPPP